MKKTLIILFTILSMCNVFAQVDSLDSKIKTEYTYEKVGNRHFYVISTTMADSSETEQRIPFQNKAQVIAFAKKQADDADSIAASIKVEIDKKEEYRKNLQDQIKQYNEILTKEFQKLNADLRALRTQRKLIIESKSKNNNVK